MSFKRFLKENHKPKNVLESLLTYLGGKDKLKDHINASDFKVTDTELSFCFEGSPSCDKVVFTFAPSNDTFYNVNFYKTIGEVCKEVMSVFDVPMTEIQRTFESATQLRLEIGTKLST